MMNHSLKSRCKVNPGTIIEGKWHNNQYTIIKELGFGANGIVYLAKWHNTFVALKMSDNGMSITSEANVLKSFSKVQGSALGPSLLDVDDWERKEGNISFYVMEYVKGPDFMSFIKQEGFSWMPVLILQLLSDLEILHQNGWVFGDLKPENLIVTGPPAKIRCIDVGGTTMKGRAIKEFTEFYDRGYWGMGSRRADPGYDLFSVAMIMMHTVYPKRFNKPSDKSGKIILSERIKQSSQLQKLSPVIHKALEGNYQTANEMRSDIIQIINKEKKVGSFKPSQSRVTLNHKSSRQVNRKKKHKRGLVETFCICTIVLLFYAFYIYGQLL